MVSQLRCHEPWFKIILDVMYLKPQTVAENILQKYVWDLKIFIPSSFLPNTYIWCIPKFLMSYMDQWGRIQDAKATLRTFSHFIFDKGVKNIPYRKDGLCVSYRLIAETQCPIHTIQREKSLFLFIVCRGFSP